MGGSRITGYYIIIRELIKIRSKRMLMLISEKPKYNLGIKYPISFTRRKGK